jgi:triosephosphate isomerase
MTRPLVTAKDLDGVAEPVIPPGAILTPLARDLLRKRGIDPKGLSSTGGAADTLVVANWKSHKTVAEAEAFAATLRDVLQPGGAGVVICPPFTALQALGCALKGLAEVGAQDVSADGEGAHTGEIAARHLVEVGCTYVIVGHSERRHAGEGDAIVGRKLRRVLAAGLRPILCVGETGSERKAGRAESIVSRQLQILRGLEPARLRRVLVAYEPRWAIGTGLTPTASEVQAMLAHARGAVGRIQPEAAPALSVLYGGSVKPSNARELLALPDCNGGLIGGAALDAHKLAAIVSATRA